MALVPYRVSGASADQTSETRLFQIGGSTITIHQQASGSLRQVGNSSGDPPLEARPSSPSRGEMQLVRADQACELARFCAYPNRPFRCRGRAKHRKQ